MPATRRASVVEQSATGAIVEGSEFAHTNANLGRWKSPHSLISRNTFSNANLCNLEIVPLQVFLNRFGHILSGLSDGNTNGRTLTRCRLPGCLRAAVARG